MYLNELEDTFNKDTDDASNKEIKDKFDFEDTSEDTEEKDKVDSDNIDVDNFVDLLDIIGAYELLRHLLY